MPAAHCRATAADLSAIERLGENALETTAAENEAALDFFDDAGEDRTLSVRMGSTGQGYGPQVDRSILEMVQEQSRRLQSMSDELDTVRASLNERKLVERAKGLLMAHRQLSEEEAHKTMRQMAMNQNRRLVEVAEAVLAMAEVLLQPTFLIRPRLGPGAAPHKNRASHPACTILAPRNRPFPDPEQTLRHRARRSINH
ncbi:MAG: ANTAR domain-containing protein [Aliarcobacter sp.]|nr:ANTAR domain-containing protein [Aliarcobacter sp.]